MPPPCLLRGGWRSRVLLLLLLLLNHHHLLKPCAARGAGPRTVMAFVSAPPAEWARAAAFLRPGGPAAGSVNAVSFDNLYSFNPSRPATRQVVPAPANINLHANLFVPHFRTYPMIGFGGAGNISVLREEFLESPPARAAFVSFFVAEVVARGYDGLHIDFEPRTDVLHPANNPTARDGLLLADFLSELGAALHAANASKTLSLDAMAVTGACWTAGGSLHPALDRKPCPWIRRLWDLSALSEVDELDRIVSMDTYTANSTEYALDLQQYQFFFPIERVGVGFCPIGCGHRLPTEGCVEGRIAAAVAYGAAEFDVWSLWDSTARNWSAVEAMWAPFVGPFRRFLAGQTPTMGGGPLCWNGTTVTTTNVAA